MVWHESHARLQVRRGDSQGLGEVEEEFCGVLVRRWGQHPQGEQAEQQAEAQGCHGEACSRSTQQKQRLGISEEAGLPRWRVCGPEQVLQPAGAGQAVSQKEGSLAAHTSEGSKLPPLGPAAGDERASI